MARRSTRSKQAGLRRKVVQALRTVSDVAIDYNIYDLGCVYAIDVDEDGRVEVHLTLTERGKPRELGFVGEVRGLLQEIDGINEVYVKLVWEPAWSAVRMSDQARADLAVSG